MYIGIGIVIFNSGGSFIKRSFINHKSIPSIIKLKMVQKNLPHLPCKVFIYNSLPVVCVGLERIINDENFLKVCGKAYDYDNALDLIEETKPDIVLLEIYDKYIGNIDRVKHTKRRFPELPILVVSTLDESRYAVQCVRAGAGGYVTLKKSDEIIKAISKVLKNEKYLSESILENYLDGDDDKRINEVLSPREFSILGLKAQGKTSTQIAKECSLSVKAVSTYCARIGEKLKVPTNMVDQVAVRWDLGKIRRISDIPLNLKKKK